MMGALIITVVLMGSIFLGFMTSVEKVPTTNVTYDYVTDGTSLFSYTQSPEYVDYSPNINYTHYTTDLTTAESASASNFYTTGVSYTEAGKVNQYRVFEQADSATTSINLSTMTFSTYVDSGTSSHKVLLGPMSNYVESGGYYYYSGAYGSVTAPKIISLTTLLNSGSYSSNGKTTVFDVPSTVWVVYGANFAWKTVYTSVSKQSSVIYTDQCQYGTSLTSATIQYNPVTGETTVYRGYDGTGVYTGTSSQIYLVYGGTYSAGLYGGSFPPTGAMSCTVTTPQAATYMDISAGVRLSSSSVYWTNGYNLGAVDILLKAPTTTSTLTIKSSAGDSLASVTYNPGYGHMLGSTILGKWDAALLSLNMRTGTATLTGVSSPTSMVDYSASSYSVATTFAASGDIRILQYSGIGWTTSVNKTSVYMDTYSMIMQDPTVNLSDYFASSEYLRLNFDSFAVYGDSITVNGTTYTVTDGKISVEADGRTREYDLTNMFVTWEKDGHVYLTFSNSSTKIDLGETATKSLSLGGDWYFDAAIYEGTEVAGYSYELDSGQWSLTQNAFLLIFLGLLVLAALIVKATKGLGPLDCVILVMAGVVGFILLS